MNSASSFSTLLDAGELPVADLARIAMREGIRPRPAYQAHKWFARRLAITARSLLVAAATPSGERFWPAFYRGDLWRDKTVLDPFVGGGVMLLEARRLGADVRGVDIEPVAAAIARFQTTLRDLPDLREPLQKLIDGVGMQMASYYRVQNEHGEPETLVHAFWVQQMRCRGCRTTFDAHPTFRFAWDQAQSRQWVACSGCSQVLERKFEAQSIVCACGSKTKPDEGHGSNGSATCPTCGTAENLLDYARRTRRPPQFRLFAVETLPGLERGRVGIPSRRIRTAGLGDHACFEAAKKKLHAIRKRNPTLLPNGPIPREGRSDNRLIDYGYNDYQEMFNARQQLHLALLGAAIRRLRGPVRDAMAIAFSDHLITNNMMCAYAGGWRRLTPLFSIRAYRHIARPVELNPWLRHNGRGTFPNAVRAVVRAGESLKVPQEPTLKNTLRSVEDAPAASCEVRCGDARRMAHLPAQSVDLVLTDPPYFDYISYSELGHFFVPWLSRFGLIPKSAVKGFPAGQLASSGRTADAEHRFSQHLARAFREIHRVSKSSGRIVFTYQNLDGRGWSAMARAMAKAGVIPTQTFPLFGDSSASLHKHAQSISWDSVMVCRSGSPIPRFRMEAVDRRHGQQVAARWQMALKKKDHVLTSGDIANLTHASAIVHAFRRLAIATASASDQPRVFSRGSRLSAMAR